MNTQAGVDVAIATKILTLVCEDQLDTLILIAGDGDFLDALKVSKFASITLYYDTL